MRTGEWANAHVSAVRSFVFSIWITSGNMRGYRIVPDASRFAANFSAGRQNDARGGRAAEASHAACKRGRRPVNSSG